MTIDLTAAEAGTGNVTLAVDLTLLGAVSGDAFERLGAELPVEYANYPQLASCAHAASRGGIAFVCLTQGFHARSDVPHALDAVKVAARLLSQGSGHVSAHIPLESIDEGLEILGEEGHKASVCVALESGYDEESFRLAAEKSHTRGLFFDLVIRPDELDARAYQLAGEVADKVRLLTDDMEIARKARSSIRKYARRVQREVQILGELGIVISGSMLAANERALLVEAMTGEPPFAGKASVIGTVYDVADAIECWVGAGCVDGMVLIPASLPSDLASVIRGVIPLLQARSSTD